MTVDIVIASIESHTRIVGIPLVEFSCHFKNGFRSLHYYLELK